MFRLFEHILAYSKKKLLDVQDQNFNCHETYREHLAGIFQKPWKDDMVHVQRKSPGVNLRNELQSSLELNGNSNASGLLFLGKLNVHHIFIKKFCDPYELRKQPRVIMKSSPIFSDFYVRGKKTSSKQKIPRLKRFLKTATWRQLGWR